MEKNEVKEFYNDFLKSTMLKYRLHGNLRIDMAKARILPEITKTSNVLDIGCGIGIVTEQIAKKATNGYVWGIDLSKENIWYSKKTISKSNLAFYEIDIIDDFDKLVNIIDTPIDIITMMDVIEHIPLSDRPRLFKNISKISSKNAKLILTYPSPEYQRYLKENNPSALQIIDNSIEIQTLITETLPSGFIIKFYSLESIWREHDYIHVILQKRSSNTINLVRPNVTLIKKIISKTIKIKNRLMIPFRRKKYIKDVFK